MKVVSERKLKRAGSYRSVFAGCLAAVLLSACGGNREQKSAEETSVEETAKIPVKVQKVTEQPVEQLIELTGNIQAFKNNDIATTVPGRITDIFVEVGDRVHKGQKLVQMDRTNLLQARIQLQNTEKELARVDTLFRLGSATQQQLDQLTTQVDVAREALRNLEENTTLLSPIDGVVTLRNFDPKNIYPGAPAILNVQQISPVKVLIGISEAYFPRVKAGMTVKVRLDVYPDKLFEGKISIVYPTINQASRTFMAEVSIPNSDTALRPGMFARVELNFGTMSHVVVPDRAVIKQVGTNHKYVFVVENGIAYQKKVEIGRRDGTSYELLSGVENGAFVVTAGQSKLLDGTKVTITDN
ncbi:MAG: efflux RND transporter periplasmic adaptor subunit [Bacteroidales bacterium]|jgi:RND family efflux transporter MFP subunit|nr:efflux RND transporter periplasmic adaptor subunit [Bacteroidales bacterium]